jgi:hypothetical protein
MSDTGCVSKKAGKRDKRVSKYAELPFDTGIEKFLREHLERYRVYLGKRRNCISKKCFWFFVSNAWSYHLPIMVLAVFPETREVEILSIKSPPGGSLVELMLARYGEKSGHCIKHKYKLLF